MLIITSEIIPKSAKGKPGPIRSKACITVFDTTTGIKYLLWALGEIGTKSPPSNSCSKSQVSLTISSIHSSIQYYSTQNTDKPHEMKSREIQYEGAAAAEAWSQLGNFHKEDTIFQAALCEGKRFIAEHCPLLSSTCGT